MRLLGPKFPNIAEENGELYTLSSYSDFGEQPLERDGKTWRHWDAKRSKLGAAIKKQISQLGIKETDSVLYLGAAHGYTPTFVADIVGSKGAVFCLDFSANVVRDLLKKCKARTNMIPVLGDAKHPETYSFRVSGVDVVFQDVAQKDQVRIFTVNCEHYLKEGGFGLLSLKARSVDMTKHPKDVFKEAYVELEKKFKVVDYRELHPFEKDHAFFIIKKT